MHPYCRHVSLGPGTCYCLSTKAIYIQPEKVPTESRRKVRGDDFDVFARRARTLTAIIRPRARVAAVVMLSKEAELPKGANDFPTIVEFYRHLDSLKMEENKA